MEQFPHQPGQQPPFILAHPGESGEEGGFDFWGVLSRRKWLVFLGLICGMALGALYNAQCADVYRSQARVRIEPKDPMMIFQNIHQPGILPGASDMSIRHDQLIGQPNIVKKCILNNGLEKLKSFTDTPDNDIISEVVDNLEITQNKEEVILYDLVYYSPVPSDCQTILNNLIATYAKDLEQQYKDESQKVETLVRTMNDKFEIEYKQLQEEAKKLHANYSAPIVDVGNRNVHDIKILELGRAMQDKKDQLSFLTQDEQRASEVLRMGKEPVKSLIWILQNEGKIKIRQKDNRIKDERAKQQAEMSIREDKMRLREMQVRLGEGHPKVIALKETIADWQGFIDNSDDGTDDEPFEAEPEEILRRYVVSLQQQIRDIQVALSKMQPEYILHHEKASEIAKNQREIESVEQKIADVRDFMQITKEKLIDIDSGDTDGGRSRHEGFRFATLRNASYGEKVWPILPLILGLGGFLGSLAGFGLGCLVELADKTFHNPDEIMKQLNVPLIGHVPVIGQSKRYLIENSLIDPIVCTYHRPKSQVSEAFRAVRTALYFNTQGKQHSVIQVTSPTPGDGKSTLASNLAVSIAQSGKKVLLVDADMRRPRQHSTFGIEAREGFATVLSGKSHWRDVMFECEEIEGLIVMPCGAKPNNPAELSSSPQVKELIDEMRQEFDFIIIDTPPLLAVTDPCPIAARVDGVVLCLRIKKNVRVSAGRAIEMLGNLGANCIGLVVNGVGAQSGYGSQYTYGAYRAGYSYNGYGYGYGYGNGKYYDEDKRGRQATVAPPKHLENQAAKASQRPPVA